MKKLILLGLIFLHATPIFSQEERRIPFSLAVSAHIIKYNQKVDEAYEDQDLERASFLFDSLVKNHLNGTYLDNFHINPLKGEPISFEEYEKPIFLITTASWCVPGVGEIPALNDLADKFHDQIEFIALFWDAKEDVKDQSKEYSENVQLMYVDELTNHDSHIVNKLKHSLGFPMTYLMDEEKKILDIRKVVTHHSSETLSNSYTIHYNSLSKGVSLLVAHLDLDIDVNLEDDGTTKGSDTEQEEYDEEYYEDEEQD